jgi:trimethylamine--corrinoid protein Co-methyltransferase
MQHADVLAGNPEYGMLKAASVQLGNYIGLPTGCGMLLTDSPQLDIQAGMEKVGSSFLSQLSGADLSVGMGLLSKLMIFSLASLVVDAEAVACFNRIREGINCDDDHLAVETYKEVGPAGEFLTSNHTADFFKSELWYSKIAYRDSFSSWIAGGKATSMESNVKEYIEKTLQEYQPPGLPGDFLNAFESQTANHNNPKTKGE